MKQEGVENPALDGAVQLVHRAAADFIGQVDGKFGDPYYESWGDQSQYAEQSRLDILAALNDLANL
jgi:hypothetical protein